MNRNNINKYNLSFEDSLKSWDDALPLGNGLLGCLIWGEGEPLNFSLDRADLWDTRQSELTLREDFNFAELKSLVKNRKQDEIIKRFDSIYDEATPTKIPAGRLEVNYGEKSVKVKSNLDIESAEAKVELIFAEEKSVINSFLHATNRYGYIKILGNKSPQINIKAHNFTRNDNSEDGKDSLDTSDVSVLNYKPYSEEIIDDIKLVIQETNEELTFALILGEAEYKDRKEVCYYIASSNDGNNWLEDSIKKVKKALKDGYDFCFESHKNWWGNYWDKSSINIPNEKIEKLWHINTYLFGSTSREGCPPMALQGVWTADMGKLPPWKGDYHNDLNTQFSYLHYLKSNRIDEGKSFIDFLWELTPSAKNHANKFFGTDGFAFPGIMDIKGRPLGGWTQYSFSIANHCWLCEMFHEYWLYTGDDEFLKDKGYVFLKESAKVIMSLLEENQDGYYNIPLSTSPEIHDNTLEAWFNSTSNYDLAIIKYLFKALLDESKHLEYKEDELLWKTTLDKLQPFHVKEKVLMINKEEKLEESHRHHSHCIGIYPLDLLRYENNEDKDIIESTIQDLERLGEEYWVGYSFVWMAALYTRFKDGEKAEKELEIFNDSITSINGFHINGDYKNNTDMFYKYKIFTLEGNMAAIASIQEMLLQTYDNTVRIFEAVPSTWKDKGVSFENLRAEGGVLVSAAMEEGNIKLFEMLATVDWDFYVKNPYGDVEAVLECNGEKTFVKGDVLKISGLRGNKYKLYL